MIKQWRLHFTCHNYVLSLWVTLNKIAHSAVDTNHPICLGLFVALMKEVDRGTFSVVELAPVKRARKSTVIITKKEPEKAKN